MCSGVRLATATTCPAPSCGCTVASVKPDVLKPGDKGELVFTINVSHGGKIEKYITVPSNDTATPSVRLTIKADVKKSIEISPTAINLGDLRRAER